MSRVEDFIKLFGTNNHLILNDLDRIENQFQISLGHKLIDKDIKDDAYYPQFESVIRAEAKMMAQHYELFYCLENAIRSLIKATMEAAIGTSWWDSGKVPKNVIDEVSKRIKKEADSGVSRRSMEQIYYTTFGELSEIIKANWDIYGSLFNNQKAVESIVNRLNTLRGPIAHCSPLAEDEVLRLKLSVRDWFRLME
jgi:hypothetical protein